MWSKTHSKLYPHVSKDIIWKLWTDIDHWPTWHSDLEYCKLNGPFDIGSTFKLKPKGVPAVTIEITDMINGSSFTDCTRFFGAKMVDTHTVEETPDGIKLTNTLTVTGPLKWLWIKLVAQNVADTIPDEMDALINLARTTMND